MVWISSECRERKRFGGKVRHAVITSQRTFIGVSLPSAELEMAQSVLGMPKLAAVFAESPAQRRNLLEQLL